MPGMSRLLALHFELLVHIIDQVHRNGLEKFPMMCRVIYLLSEQKLRVLIERSGKYTPLRYGYNNAVDDPWTSLHHLFFDEICKDYSVAQYPKSLQLDLDTYVYHPNPCALNGLPSDTFMEITIKIWSR